MARRTRTFLITAVAGAAALIPAAGASAGTLDQQQTLLTFGGLQVDSTNSKAQTFTAGLTGQLDQVDLALSGLSLTTPLTVQIRDGRTATEVHRSVRTDDEGVQRHIAREDVVLDRVGRLQRVGPDIGGDGQCVVRPCHLHLYRFGHRGDPVLDRGAHQRQFQLVLVRGGAGNRFALCGREVLRQLGRPPGDGHLDPGQPSG